MTQPFAKKTIASHSANDQIANEKQRKQLFFLYTSQPVILRTKYNRANDPVSKRSTEQKRNIDILLFRRGESVHTLFLDAANWVVRDVTRKSVERPMSLSILWRVVAFVPAKAICATRRESGDRRGMGGGAVLLARLKPRLAFW